jgi:hypothetical protein
MYVLFDDGIELGTTERIGDREILGRADRIVDGSLSEPLIEGDGVLLGSDEASNFPSTSAYECIGDLLDDGLELRTPDVKVVLGWAEGDMNGSSFELVREAGAVSSVSVYEYTGVLISIVPSLVGDSVACFASEDGSCASLSRPNGEPVLDGHVEGAP